MAGDVVDDLGTPVEVAADPRRLVSLVPSVSEALWSWGLADRLVGVTDWCVEPPDAFHGATRIRGTKNPDVSRIVELAPDLVVANEEENRELDVRRLREAGVPVYVTRVRTVADAADALERLGRVVGAEGAGRRSASDLRDALEAAAQPAAGGAGADPAVSCLCPIWRDPWMAVGPDTFAGSLLEAAGASVWHPPDDRRYPRVDLARARAAGVELVLLPDEPYPFGDEDRGAFAGWDASVRLIEGAALTWWGPRTPRALAVLSALVAEVRRRRT